MQLKLRVGKLAREKGLTEKDLSDRTKLARNTVRALMRGSVVRADFVTLEKIAAALEVRPLELFEEVEGQPGQRKPRRKAA